MIWCYYHDLWQFSVDVWTWASPSQRWKQKSQNSSLWCHQDNSNCVDIVTICTVHLYRYGCMFWFITMTTITKQQSFWRKSSTKPSRNPQPPLYWWWSSSRKFCLMTPKNGCSSLDSSSGRVLFMFTNIDYTFQDHRKNVCESCFRVDLSH